MYQSVCPCPVRTKFNIGMQVLEQFSKYFKRALKSPIQQNIFQILWKSECYILVTFPSHLKKLHSLLRF